MDAEPLKPTSYQQKQPREVEIPVNYELVHREYTASEKWFNYGGFAVVTSSGQTIYNGVANFFYSIYNLLPRCGQHDGASTSKAFSKDQTQIAWAQAS